jgi:hypothetical protein
MTGDRRPDETDHEPGAQHDRHRHHHAAPAGRSRPRRAATHPPDRPGLDDTSVADALGAYFGYLGAIDILLAAADLDGEILHALLTASAEHSQKAETVR